MDAALGGTVESTAPEIQVSNWFNTPAPLTLAALRGEVVMLHAFQMLCPGCVMQETPQAVRVWNQFRERGLKVIGLHTVFEHHAVMTPEALAVYLHEFRIPFPVGVDRASTDRSVPQTMAAYEMRGTPTTILIDRAGEIRHHHFGSNYDGSLADEIEILLSRN